MTKSSSRKLWFIGLLLCILIPAVFTACQQPSGGTNPVSTPTQVGQPQYGGTLRYSMLSDGVSIGFPAKLANITGNRQAAPAIETLLRIDKTGKPIPWLATEFREDAINKNITFSLRKGVKFHDGTDFNAEAVKWNLEKCKSAKAAGTENFKSVDIVDDSTIRLNLIDWDSTIIGNLAGSIGMIISPTAYNKNGEEWCANNPVGTGPFQFVSWQKAAKTTYKKFDGYWQKGKPYLDELEYIPIADSTIQEMALRNGDIDILLNSAARDLSSMRNAGFIISLSNSGAGALALIPDSGNPKSPFADIRVRQAVTYAIDTESITKNILYGMGTSTNQFIYKGHWAYNSNVVGYPYSPVKAKQLLTEAGYPNGFKTKITYLVGSSDLIMTSVQGFLKAAGMDIQMDPVQVARIGLIARGSTWEGLAQSTYSGNSDMAAWFNTRYNGNNNYVSMLVPDDYTQAIKNAVSAPTFEIKQKWTQEAMKLMIDKYCLVSPLYCPMDSAVCQKKVHNHGFNANPNVAFWTPEETWIEK